MGYLIVHHVTLIHRPYNLRSVTASSPAELQVCLPGRQSGNQR